MSVEMYEKLTREIDALAEYLGADILRDRYGNVKVVSKKASRHYDGGDE